LNIEFGIIHGKIRHSADFSIVFIFFDYLTKKGPSFLGLGVYEAWVER